MIRIVVLGRHGVHGTGTDVAVDGFVAGGVAVPTADVTYGWSTRRAAGASGGSVAIDDERGASLVLRFRGTSIRWLTARGPAEGRAEVFIDGRHIATFDGYAAQSAYGVARSFGGLTDEVHTLRILVLGTARRASSGTAVAVDGFEIG